MRGCSAAKREDIANMDLRVVLWLPLHGNTMVRQFRVNNTKYWAVSSEQSVWSNFSTSWKFDRYCVNVVQGKQQIALGQQNVTAVCPKDVIEFMIFCCESGCIIVVYRLLWSPYTVRSGFLQGPWWRVHAEGALELPIQKSWREHRDTVVHSSLHKPCSLRFLDSYLLRLYHLEKVPQTNFFWLRWWQFYYRKKKDHQITMWEM